LAIAMLAAKQQRTCCVVELGSAFTACLVVRDGQIVDGVGGTSGPFGWQSGGAWDGEAAYFLGPLRKRDLFAGGVSSISDRALGLARFRESLMQTVAGLQVVTPFAHIVLSGRLLETEPAFTAELKLALAALGTVDDLVALPGAFVKHAAQGAAVLADGLAGGTWASLVEQVALRGAAGTILEWLALPPH
jgi:predicted butyrate kinase (DUF1464 family)